MTMNALEFEDVRKSFGAVHALRGVSFRVESGEAHAVVGENGAGKSTLLKILAGITRADAGHIRLNGAPFDHGTPREALAAGLGLVYQERLAFPDLSVAANIFVGREATRASGRLDDASMRARTATLLGQLGVRAAPETPMDRLSAADAQLVQVARALAFDCRVLVLDEPTTSLTDAEVAHLFRILDELRSRGVTILFVSHRLPEVFRLCQRVTVLRDGTYAGTFETRAATPADIVRAMVGREPPPKVVRPAIDRSGAPALSLDRLSRPPAVRDVSLAIWPGEIVGLFGLVGAGRSELVETLFGIHPAVSGEVKVAGAPHRFTEPRQAARAGLGLVPEDRQRLGLHFNLDLGAYLMLPAGACGHAYRTNAVAERPIAERAAAEVALKASSLSALPDSLSGGNQQKLVVAKWLMLSPSVLLLDEPTKGVDVGAKFQLHEIIRARAAKGTACLVVSSELPELLAVADRILVMRGGRLAGEVPGATATEEAVMRLATGEVAA